MLKEINGKKYRLPTLDIFQEFALASTLSPILSLMSLQTDKSKLAERFPQAFAALIGQVGMSRQEKDELIRMCMAGVTRDENNVFAPVMVNGQIMYADININVVLTIMWEILVAHKLIDFFSEPHSNSTEQPGGSKVSSGRGTRTTG